MNKTKTLRSSTQKRKKDGSYDQDDIFHTSERQ